MTVVSEDLPLNSEYIKIGLLQSIYLLIRM